jgi:hypothetical protein
MSKVDFLKLAEQYASFLVAIGGVSITVLTLVLSLSTESAPTKVNARSYLVAAMVVATVSCFIGAHMMAETAAFIEAHKNVADPSGQRLFIFASVNIFVAVVLVLFASVLLPLSSGRVPSATITPISFGLFGLIVAGALYWMILAAKYRMPVPGNTWAIVAAVVLGIVWAIVLLKTRRSEKYFLVPIFGPSVLTTVLSLVFFAWIFKEGDIERLQRPRIGDIYFFALAISVSYASLVVAGIKIMRDLDWREWLRENAETLNKCGLPETVFESRANWWYFLKHDQLDPRESSSKFTVSNLSVSEAKCLKEFLESELTEGEKEKAKDVLSRLEKRSKGDAD